MSVKSLASNTYNLVRSFAAWPAKLFREDEYFLGGLLSAVYGGLAFLSASVAADLIKEEQFSYQDKDPQTGKITVYNVDAGAGLVELSLKDGFSKVANFSDSTLYDVKTRIYEVPVHAYAGDSLIETGRTAQFIERASFNKKSLSAVTSEESAEIEKMQGYLQDARERFSYRLAKVMK